MGKLAYVSIDIPVEYQTQIMQIGAQIKNHLLEQNIIFDCMDQANIHLTICFIGGRLKNQKKDTLAKFNSIVDKYNKNLHGSLFEFDNYDLFPITKKNLVVAKFKLKPELQNIIMSLKKDLSKLGLLDEYNESFTAHITMGKILSKSKYTIDWETFLDSIQKSPNFKANGCLLCGYDAKFD